MAGQRKALGRKLTANQQERRTATRRFQSDLKDDGRYRLRKVGKEIEALVVND